MNHMNNTSKIISGVIILAVVAGGSFYWGMSYGKGQAAASANATRADFAIAGNHRRIKSDFLL